MNNLLKIGTPFITSPNFKGRIIKETPKTLIIELLSPTFEDKSSLTLTHNFSQSQIEYFNDGFKPFTRRFWKDSCKEIGGNMKIILD